MEILTREELVSKYDSVICDLCFANGCEVIVINGMDVSDTEELAADMMSLLASFSGKFYSKRSAERRKKKAK